MPFLILLAVVLLAAQDGLRALLLRRTEQTDAAAARDAWSILPVVSAAVYGGYFGAGVSVIVLAALGLALEDSLTRLNALKQAISFSISIAAAVFFLFSGQIVWPAALVMAAGSLSGGALGGRLAGRISPVLLRRIIVIGGIAVAFVFLVR